MKGHNLMQIIPKLLVDVFIIKVYLQCLKYVFLMFQIEIQ